MWNDFRVTIELQTKRTKESRPTTCPPWSDKERRTRWDVKLVLGSRLVAAKKVLGLSRPETGLPSYHTLTCKTLTRSA